MNTRKYVASYKYRKDRVGRAGQLETKMGRQARQFGNHYVRSNKCASRKGAREPHFQTICFPPHEAVRSRALVSCGCYMFSCYTEKLVSVVSAIVFKRQQQMVCLAEMHYGCVTHEEPFRSSVWLADKTTSSHDKRNTACSSKAIRRFITI